MSTVEEALVDVILDEIRAQRYTYKQIQDATGIKSRTFQNYFVQRTRPVPIKAVYAIAAVLEVPGHELMARAEARASEGVSHEAAADAALAKMPPDLAEQVRRVDREQRDAREEDVHPVTVRRTNITRSAMTGG